MDKSEKVSIDIEEEMRKAALLRDAINEVHRKLSIEQSEIDDRGRVMIELGEELSELKKELEAIEKFIKIVVGSIVEVIKFKKTFFVDKVVKVGEMGKVIKINKNSALISFEKLDKDLWINLADLILVKKEEVYHRYLFEERFNKAGRKYGEYRTGDILMKGCGSLYTFHEEDGDWGSYLVGNNKNDVLDYIYPYLFAPFLFCEEVTEQALGMLIKRQTSENRERKPFV